MPMLLSKMARTKAPSLGIREVVTSILGIIGKFVTLSYSRHPLSFKPFDGQAWILRLGRLAHPDVTAVVDEQHCQLAQRYTL